MKDTIREIKELKEDLSAATPIAESSSEALLVNRGLAPSREDEQAGASSQRENASTDVQHALSKMSLGHNDAPANIRPDNREESDGEGFEDLDFCVGRASNEEVSLLDFAVSQPIKPYPVHLNVESYLSCPGPGLLPAHRVLY